MAGALESNKLLKIIGIAVVVMTVFVLFTVFSGDEEEAGPILSKAPSADGSGESDTTQETLERVNINVKQLRTQLEELKKENETLKQADTDKEEKIKQATEQLNLKIEQAQGVSGDEQSKKLEEITKRLDEIGQGGVPAGELPVGGGPADVIWVTPLQPPLGPEGTVPFAAPGAAPAAPEAEEVEEEEKPAATIPVHTIPKNATLLSSTAMTSLIGRIPVGGQVQDPFRFKALVGPDNLASNGLKIPNIVGSVWSGVLIGDFALACVRGVVDSVTFTFSDGTIRTISAEGSQDFSGGAGSLGFITDPRGVPCISGKLITNAPLILGLKILSAGTEAAAAAIAKAEVTEEPGEDGGEKAENVTGDKNKFTIGKTLEGGAKEVTKFVDDRLGLGFDAVFVSSGERIVIHISQEIPIDYDPNGRKIYYGNANPTVAPAGNSTNLD